MSKNIKIKEDLKRFILEKVKSSISEDRPFFFLKWSGLYELCQSYGIDLIKLIDEMAAEGLVKKALIKGRLAITLPNVKTTSKKARLIIKEFEEFLNR